MERKFFSCAALVLLACGQPADPGDDGGDFLRDAGPGTDAGGTDAGGPPVDGGPPTDAGMPDPEGCIMDVTAGHHVYDCDGIPYDVELSAACAAGGCGLIFDVHGATMDAGDEDRNTNLRALAPPLGYVVVQPTAPPGAIGPSWDPARDDPKVFAFLELAIRVFSIDPDRVHFTGFSQGGFMTWRMLCQHADLFASVAPAAACGGLFEHCAFTATERPSRELPVLYVHGSEDIIVSGCASMQRDAVVNGWAMSVDTIVSMDANHTWTRYRSASGNVFEYIEHSYTNPSFLLQGHCFPGSTDTTYGCQDAAAFTWGEAVLAFFEAHPRN